MKLRKNSLQILLCVLRDFT